MTRRLQLLRLERETFRAVARVRAWLALDWAAAQADRMTLWQSGLRAHLFSKLKKGRTRNDSVDVDEEGNMIQDIPSEGSGRGVRE